MRNVWFVCTTLDSLRIMRWSEKYLVWFHYPEQLENYEMIWEMFGLAPLHWTAWELWDDLRNVWLGSTTLNSLKIMRWPKKCLVRLHYTEQLENYEMIWEMFGLAPLHWTAWELWDDLRNVWLGSTTLNSLRIMRWSEKYLVRLHYTKQLENYEWSEKCLV